jgi:hypothetical protein
MNGLDRFEALAEQLVEGTFERLFRPRLHPSQVARQLARAMEDGSVAGHGGQLLVPNRYWVFLNDEDFAALDAGGEALRDALLRYLQRLATESGARFGGRLQVGLHAATHLGSGQFDVRAAHRSPADEGSDTQGVKVELPSAAEASRWSLEGGGRTFPLGGPVIRLGRALSNDVILDDRRISRSHAQLRWRAGSYHLSDMGSRSGTRLNGRPLGPQDQVPLTTGDVIDLAGVRLTVYTDAEPPDLNT